MGDISAGSGISDGEEISSSLDGSFGIGSGGVGGGETPVDPPVEENSHGVWNTSGVWN